MDASEQGNAGSKRSSIEGALPTIVDHPALKKLTSAAVHGHPCMPARTLSAGASNHSRIKVWTCLCICMNGRASVRMDMYVYLYNYIAISTVAISTLWTLKRTSTYRPALHAAMFSGVVHLDLVCRRLTCQHMRPGHKLSVLTNPPQVCQPDRARRLQSATPQAS
jgi:hypothetical protein